MRDYLLLVLYALAIGGAIMTILVGFSALRWRVEAGIWDRVEIVGATAFAFLAAASGTLAWLLS